MHTNDKILVTAMITCCVLAILVGALRMCHATELANSKRALKATQTELDDLKHEAVVRGHAQRSGSNRQGFAWNKVQW